MRKPIHKASLDDLIFIVQHGSGWIDSRGQWESGYAPMKGAMFYVRDDAADEIERRFKALQRKIRQLEKTDD